MNETDGTVDKSFDLDFSDLELQEVPIIFAGKNYTLREASGEAAVRYRNALTDSADIGEGGKVTRLKNIASVEPLLVSLCLFTESGKRLSAQGVAQLFPARVLKKIFDTAMKISGLKEAEGKESLVKQKEELEKAIQALDEAEELAGNDSGGLQDG